MIAKKPASDSSLIQERHDESARQRLPDLMRTGTHMIICAKWVIDIVNITDIQIRSFIYCIYKEIDKI